MSCFHKKLVRRLRPSRSPLSAHEARTFCKSSSSLIYTALQPERARSNAFDNSGFWRKTLTTVLSRRRNSSSRCVRDALMIVDSEYNAVIESSAPLYRCLSWSSVWTVLTHVVATWSTLAARPMADTGSIARALSVFMGWK
jgi:hypothetical protein